MNGPQQRATMRAHPWLVALVLGASAGSPACSAASPPTDQESRLASLGQLQDALSRPMGTASPALRT
jgi:hypothetical protein